MNVSEMAEMPSFLDRQGIARPIAWGFVAVALFMVGDGIESGFLAAYLSNLGVGVGAVSILFAAYGGVSALASWLSGVLSEAWGPKQVMMIGFGVWVALEIVFLLGIEARNFPLAFVAYAIRGVAYPLFVYGFFAWITFITPSSSMSRAAGWFWFSYLFGFGVIGGYFGGWMIPITGELGTQWLSIAFTGAGGLLVLFLVRALRPTERATISSTLRSVVAGATVLKTSPKVGIGGAIRLINAFSIYVFIALLGTYMTKTIGLTIMQWQTIWGTAFLANVLSNVLVGYIGGACGELRVVKWLGCFGCAMTSLAMFYVPQVVGPNFWLILSIGIVWGVCVSGFIPVSAIVPRLAPGQVAAAVSVLSFAAGLSQMPASLIAALAAPFGIATAIWVLAATYVLAFVLTFALREERTPPQRFAGEMVEFTVDSERLGESTVGPK
ncbi:MFS transporter [Paraburkholderia dipogonis]|uniref:MFS transporter n=1 Tax=Paraburkholderia dipogonis TaxID=1211383 RepID=A0A4Y8MWU6_9BURK|nr:RbtT/DalT/CsbX family MFS transporter [Paraburkholderia dipogonis]TFE41914.1 MFS transporter [Paraburkholderia dipogonis]